MRLQVGFGVRFAGEVRCGVRVGFAALTATLRVHLTRFLVSRVAITSIMRLKFPRILRNIASTWRVLPALRVTGLGIPISNHNSDVRAASRRPANSAKRFRMLVAGDRGMWLSVPATLSSIAAAEYNWRSTSRSHST
jgi:hypothetical protein